MNTALPTASALRARRSPRVLLDALLRRLGRLWAEETSDRTPLPTEEEAVLGHRCPYLPTGLPLTF